MDETSLTERISVLSQALDMALRKIRDLGVEMAAVRELSRYAAHTEDCELSLYADGDCGFAGSPCERDEDDGHEHDTCTCGHDEALSAVRRGGK